MPTCMLATCSKWRRRPSWLHLDSIQGWGQIRASWGGCRLATYSAWRQPCWLHLACICRVGARLEPLGRHAGNKLGFWMQGCGQGLRGDSLELKLNKVIKTQHQHQAGLSGSSACFCTVDQPKTQQAWVTCRWQPMQIAGDPVCWKMQLKAWKDRVMWFWAVRFSICLLQKNDCCLRMQRKQRQEEFFRHCCGSI